MCKSKLFKSEDVIKSLGMRPVHTGVHVHVHKHPLAAAITQLIHCLNPGVKGYCHPTHRIPHSGKFSRGFHFHWVCGPPSTTNIKPAIFYTYSNTEGRPHGTIEWLRYSSKIVQWTCNREAMALRRFFQPVPRGRELSDLVCMLPLGHYPWQYLHMP